MMMGTSFKLQHNLIVNKYNGYLYHDLSFMGCTVYETSFNMGPHWGLNETLPFGLLSKQILLPAHQRKMYILVSTVVKTFSPVSFTLCLGDL